jgi:hypothetical protein
MVGFLNDKKNEQDIQIIQNLDLLKLVNKYAGSFFTNRLFNTIDLPNTRNLKTVNKNRSSRRASKNHITPLGSDSDDEGKVLFKRKNLKGFIVVIIVIIFLIIIFCTF